MSKHVYDPDKSLEFDANERNRCSCFRNVKMNVTGCNTSEQLSPKYWVFLRLRVWVRGRDKGRLWWSGNCPRTRECTCCRCMFLVMVSSSISCSFWFISLCWLSSSKSLDDRIRSRIFLSAGACLESDWDELTLPGSRYYKERERTMIECSRDYISKYRISLTLLWAMFHPLATGFIWCNGSQFLKIIWSTCSMTTSWHELPMNHQFYVYPVINEVVVLGKIVEKNEML